MNDKCTRCDNKVYLTELISVNDRKFHKSCFKCYTCSKPVTMENFVGVTENGTYTVLCRNHAPVSSGRKGSLVRTTSGTSLASSKTNESENKTENISSQDGDGQNGNNSIQRKRSSLKLPAPTEGQTEPVSPSKQVRIVGENEAPAKSTRQLVYFRRQKSIADFKTVKTVNKQLMDEVTALLAEEKIINSARLEFEVQWFFGELGIDKIYFETNNAEEIAQDISSLYAAKCLAHLTGADLELKLQNTRKGRTTFAVRSVPGSQKSPAMAIEKLIEEEYLSGKSKQEKKSYRVQTFRTNGPVAPDSTVHLRFYFLTEPSYITPTVSENESDLNKVSDREFLKNCPSELKSIYQEVINKAVTQMSPVIQTVDTSSSDEKILLIAYRQRSTHNYFSGLTDLYHSLALYSVKKFLDQFSNGISIYTIYLKPRSDSPVKVIDKDLANKLVEDASLLYVLPSTPLSSLYRDGVFSASEHAYAFSAWKFAFHFLSRQAAEFHDLAGVLKDNPVGSGLLESIKKVVRKEAYTEGRIMEAILENKNIVKELYRDFESRHQIGSPDQIDSRLSEELSAKIQKTVSGELDRHILRSFLTFNKQILKTNFFKTNKVALSFRLEPSFLSKEEYSVTPFAVFMILGEEFRGFHIRMRDIARGGIRLIKSGNNEAFIQNVTTVFQENYNLASTQDRKNKDIAEGGSKGTILLAANRQDTAFEAFTKYIDAILDVLLVENEKQIKDRFGKQEILFMGPDENTANYMDWASEHAKRRGYKFWKAFTTGKSTDRGGIPHDKYGMTTRSIHQYVLGTLKKLNMKEEDCTKFQTGGPDGDLGSNEIKISLDSTIAIVDGSGVLCDPKGLNKQVHVIFYFSEIVKALLELAGARKMVREFPKEKLSPQGFYVDVDSADVKLPDGTFVNNGLDFRNTFHLNKLSSANVFVPCGGRPESVNVSNISKMFDDNKKPRYQIIVEGANLFFSQEARIALEKAGVVIFKDASANKGGVTSSSLEVLAALSMSDDEFQNNMKGGASFYEEYVKEVHRVIEENARLEFECIWSEHAKSGTPRSILSDVISNKINELSASISESNLWNNVELREKVLKEACPKNLLKLVGLETLMKRVPENYLRAMFGTYLGSRYVYTNGLSATPEFTFFRFVNSYLQRA